MNAGLPTRLADRRFVLSLAAALLALIVLVSLFSPAQNADDPRPSTYNSGSQGAKAAFLVLRDLGYQAERWEEPGEALADVDAQHTTLVLADPQVPFTAIKPMRRQIAEYLARGGMVLATGVAGASLLPHGETRMLNPAERNLCRTTPEGQGALARVGTVTMPDSGGWSALDAGSRVDQWCGQDAVVIRYGVGQGSAIWWSSARPMTNAGLKEDASLRLLLASLGGSGDRRVLFDEAVHGFESSPWDAARGLPVWALWTQCALVAALLVLSFGRRNGPLRTPVRAIRTSPLEFAESMGHLYQKAGATQVATQGARRRVVRFLNERCGIPLGSLGGEPAAIADAVEARLGGDWAGLGGRLQQAAAAEYASPAPASALALVRALDEDMDRLTELRHGKRSRERETTT
jgi:hypothetical protein